MRPSFIFLLFLLDSSTLIAEDGLSFARKESLTHFSQTMEKGLEDHSTRRPRKVQTNHFRSRFENQRKEKQFRFSDRRFKKNHLLRSPDRERGRREFLRKKLPPKKPPLSS